MSQIIAFVEQQNSLGEGRVFETVALDGTVESYNGLEALPPEIRETLEGEYPPTWPEWQTRRRWVPHGIGRRLHAGLRSLADRAHLHVEDLGSGPATACSPYGDTDTPIVVEIGDTQESIDAGPRDGIGHRLAHLGGPLFIHTSVGGRFDFRWFPTGNWHDGDLAQLTVLSATSSEVTTCSVQALEIPWGKELGDIADRAAANIAAQSLMERAPTMTEVR